MSSILNSAGPRPLNFDECRPGGILVRAPSAMYIIKHLLCLVKFSLAFKQTEMHPRSYNTNIESSCPSKILLLFTDQPAKGLYPGQYVNSNMLRSIESSPHMSKSTIVFPCECH